MDHNTRGKDAGQPPSDGAEAELRRLGLDLAGVREALERGYLTSRDMGGTNWPRTTSGFVAWAATNKFLRDRYGPEDWEPVDDDGVATILAPDGAVSVAAVKGDENTGLAHRIPSTNRPRGKAGVRRVLDNAQGDLFPGLLPPPPKTWYLLYRLHEDGEERAIRAEVSLPWEVDASGHVRGWYHRILLPEIELRRAPKKRTRHEEPEDDQLPDELTGS